MSQIVDNGKKKYRAKDGGNHRESVPARVVIPWIAKLRRSTNRRVVQANAQAGEEAATQRDESAAEVNETRCTIGGSTSHIGKNQAVENGVDGERHISRSKCRDVQGNRYYAQETAGTDVVLVRKGRRWEPEWTGESKRKASRNKKRTRY